MTGLECMKRRFARGTWISARLGSFPERALSFARWLPYLLSSRTKSSLRSLMRTNTFSFSERGYVILRSTQTIRSQLVGCIKFQPA
jgi:hypothetical protein